MKWDTSRDLATDAEIREFERVYGVRLLEEHRDFLKHVVNGGMPLQEMHIHTVNCPGGAGLLHGVYGVNSPKTYHDLGQEIEGLDFMLPELMPFGFDQGNGLLLLDMEVKPGRLLYVLPLEVLDDPMQTYHVANSIDEFLKASVFPPKEGANPPYWGHGVFKDRTGHDSA